MTQKLNLQCFEKFYNDLSFQDQQEFNRKIIDNIWTFEMQYEPKSRISIYAKDREDAIARISKMPWFRSNCLFGQLNFSELPTIREDEAWVHILGAWLLNEKIIAYNLKSQLTEY